MQTNGDDISVGLDNESALILEIGMLFNRPKIASDALLADSSRLLVKDEIPQRGSLCRGALHSGVAPFGSSVSLHLSGSERERERQLLA
jgi:hypothetical protein